MFLLQTGVILSYFVSSVEGIYIVEYIPVLSVGRGYNVCTRKPPRLVPRVMLEKYELPIECVSDSSDRHNYKYYYYY